MAFSTEFIMGAGGGSGTDLNTHEQVVTVPSSATTVGAPHVVDKAGVYGVAVLGYVSGGSSSGSTRVALLVNGVEIATTSTVNDPVSVSCFQVMHLAAGDTVTMQVWASGVSTPVFYEPTIAVASVDTVGDGSSHTGGPIEFVRDQWRTLASHTVARSGVIHVDYGISLTSTSTSQCRIVVNGQVRIADAVRANDQRWHRALSVNAGDVVEAQTYTNSFAAPGRVVNNWTISFR